MQNCGDQPNDVLEKVILKVLPFKARESFLAFFKNRNLYCPPKSCTQGSNDTVDLSRLNEYFETLMVNLRSKVLEDSSIKIMRQWQANIDLEIAVSIINHALVEFDEDKSD